MSLMRFVFFSSVLPLHLSTLKLSLGDRENLLHCFAEFLGRLWLGRGRHDRTISCSMFYGEFLDYFDGWRFINLFWRNRGEILMEGAN